MLNIRKVKKQRLPKLPHNEEQVASQKLLELSYFWDQKFEDGSQVLSEDIHKYNEKIQHSAKYKSTPGQGKLKKQAKTKFNSPSLREYRLVQLSTPFAEKKQRLIKQQECIFNTVQSNRVFVGSKIVLPTFESEYMPQCQHCIPLSEKLRTRTQPQKVKNVITMPVRINLTEFRKKIGKKSKISNKNVDLSVIKYKQSFLLPNKWALRDRVKKQILQNTFRINSIYN